jgi:hypothetical protein
VRPHLHPNHWLRIRYNSAAYHFHKRYHYALPPGPSPPPSTSASASASASTSVSTATSTSSAQQALAQMRAQAQAQAVLHDRTRCVRALHAVVSGYCAVYGRALRLRAFHCEWLSEAYAWRAPSGEDARPPQFIEKEECGKGGAYALPRHRLAGLMHAMGPVQAQALWRQLECSDYWQALEWIERAVQLQCALHGPNLPFAVEVRAKRTALLRTCFARDCSNAPLDPTYTAASSSAAATAPTAAADSKALPALKPDNTEPGAFAVCSACSRARYCSAACQASHWSEHQTRCSSSGSSSSGNSK